MLFVQVKHEVMVNSYRLPCPDGCPKPMHDIMAKTWDHAPKARPSMKKISDDIEALKKKYPYGKDVC